MAVRQRVDYKLAHITFKARRTGCPVYIASLLFEYRQTHKNSALVWWTFIYNTILQTVTR